MKFCQLVGAVVLLFSQVTAAFMMASSAFAGSRVTSPIPAVTSTNSVQMRTRVCDLLGKRANRKARVVTFSKKRIHKVQEVNLQVRKMHWPEGKRMVRLRVSTKGIKTIKKYGLHAAAIKFGLDLTKFTA
ncbi:unnamed protein product [Choristocarpus tenellus]